MIERFDEYVERCLYGPDGFYASRGEAGRSRGDFVTSPEVGPLFGAVLARALDGWWAELGRPADFVVVECGAGRGALAASILAAAPECLVEGRYVTVERSERLRQMQAELLGDRIEIRSELPDRPFVGVILANELLDNLPFRLVTHNEHGWDEVFVEDGVAVVRGPIFPGSVSVRDAPSGTRLPICEQSFAWVQRARDRLTAGRLVVFDYGVRNSAELVDRGWLRTYSGHERGDDPFDAPGTRDITTDVPFDQLPRTDTLVTQADFLRRWGIDDLVEEGRRVWTERAHLGDLDAIRGRSRVTEADALLDPDGLGGFLVAEWIRPERA